jgi:Zn-dependent peptidase ImmA (M78 family)
MCTREILVEPNTILLDNGTVDRLNKGFEFFTVMHEAGHLMMHQMVYRKDPDTDDGTVLCKRSNIGRSPDGLKTSEDFREHQANTFAACMLMPPRLFIQYVQWLMTSPWHRFDDELMITYQVNDGTSYYRHYRDIVTKTKARFGVSTRAAEVQMQKYGLVASPKEAEVREARRRLKMYRSLWA